MQTEHSAGTGKAEENVQQKKAAGAKAYSLGDYVWVFQNIIPPKGTKTTPKEVEGTLHDYGKAPGGTFL